MRYKKGNLSVYSFKTIGRDFKIMLFSKGVLGKYHWVWWHIGKWLFCIETNMPHLPYIYVPTVIGENYTTAWSYTLTELKKKKGLAWIIRNIDICFFSREKCKEKISTIPVDRFLYI